MPLHHNTSRQKNQNTLLHWDGSPPVRHTNSGGTMAKRFLCGLVLGMAAIAPGVSAGVMMVAFGLYREILQALGELMRFRRIRQ